MLQRDTNIMASLKKCCMKFDMGDSSLLALQSSQSRDNNNS